MPCNMQIGPPSRDTDWSIDKHVEGLLVGTRLCILFWASWVQVYLKINPLFIKEPDLKKS